MASPLNGQHAEGERLLGDANRTVRAAGAAGDCTEVQKWAEEVTSNPVVQKATEGRALSFHEKVRGWWAFVPPTKKVVGDVHGTWHHMALRMHLARLDKNADGHLDSTELSGEAEDAKGTAEAASSLLLNTGVVAALVLGALLPLLLAKEEEVHPWTKEMLQHWGFEDHAQNALVLYQVQAAFLLVGIVFNAIVIHWTMKTHAALSFWAPDVETKFWFLRNSSVLADCASTHGQQMLVLIVSVLPHVLIARGPWIALLTCLACGRVYFSVFFGHHEALVMIFSHSASKWVKPPPAAHAPPV